MEGHRRRRPRTEFCEDQPCPQHHHLPAAVYLFLHNCITGFILPPWCSSFRSFYFRLFPSIQPNPFLSSFVLSSSQSPSLFSISHHPTSTHSFITFFSSSCKSTFFFCAFNSTPKFLSILQLPERDSFLHPTPTLSIFPAETFTISNFRPHLFWFFFKIHLP